MFEIANEHKSNYAVWLLLVQVVCVCVYVCVCLCRAGDSCEGPAGGGDVVAAQGRGAG